mgnify:CR=1 FL=1
MKSSSKTHKIVATIAVELPYENDLLGYNNLLTDKIKSVVNSLQHVDCMLETGLKDAKLGIPQVPLNKEKKL